MLHYYITSASTHSLDIRVAGSSNFDARPALQSNQFYVSEGDNVRFTSRRSCRCNKSKTNDDSIIARKRTHPRNPKKIVCWRLPSCKLISVDEPFAGVFEASFDGPIIVGGSNDSR